MSVPDDRPITISWDQINDPVVDEKLRRSEALVSAGEELKQLPVVDHFEPARIKTGFWYNTFVYLSLFGLAGGLLGWGGGAGAAAGMGWTVGGGAAGGGESVQAREWIDARRQILQELEAGRLSPEQARAAVGQVDRVAGDNPYYAIEKDPSLSESQKEDRRLKVAAGEARDAQVAGLLFYSIAGMMIGLCLSMAEPMIQRNLRAASIEGAMGAILGLAGGVAAAFCVGWTGGETGGGGMGLISARVATWAVMGLLLSLGSTVAMRNRQKWVIGILGGIGGGMVGGVLGGVVGRLIGGAGGIGLGVVMIGMLAGLGMGWIENVAKMGWLKVTDGLIAGKQFILYRNPTYIGSSLQCAIYLFKDPQVGRRHAAVHIVPGGYEIEDLPLGGPTRVNGRPIQRTRLRHEDRIQIGGTTFLFQEKPRKTA